MKSTLAISVFLLMLISCQKDSELVTGGITGIVSVYNQDITMRSDQSGVEVRLYQNAELIDHTLTDINGRYAFQSVPYGKYNLEMHLTDFVASKGPHTVYHVGGYSPTIFNGDVYEIPTFELALDSMFFDDFRYSFTACLKIRGIANLPYDFYPLRGFAGNSPDVSKDKYTARLYGILAGWLSTPETDYGILNYWDWDLESLKSDTIYVRLYPLAFGQGDFYNFENEALGKPSNVVGFIWK